MASFSSNSVTPINIHSLVTVKLTKDNYLLWKTQIVPYLRGQRLFGFVDGTISSPSPTIPNPEAATSQTAPAEISNPHYSTWYDQDQVVLSALVSSLSENILAQMVGLSKSREVWVALERMFASHSFARAIQTRQFLASTKKGNLSISDYFQKMRSFSDNLAAIGQPLQNHEFTAYLLGGLDTSYDAIVTSISTQIDKMTSEDMFNHLLAFELRLEQQQNSFDNSVHSVNMATRNDHKSRVGRYTQHQRLTQHQSFGSNNRGRGRGYKGRGPPPNYSSNPRPQCQVCGKLGHTAIQCHYRFDHAYQGTSPHMAAYMAASSPPHDTNWYPDTGSTNHLTNNFNNLSLQSDTYLGNDQIHVGDGAGLPIKHIGSTTLSTPTTSFTLNKLLHVPQIQKNLISVSQFTRDNNVYIEFHSSSFLVKDEATGRVLLRGKPKDGLYIFPTSMTSINRPQAYLSQRVPLDVWHYRMGHPSYQTVRHLISKFSLPISSNKIPGICSACQQGKSHRLPFFNSQSVSNQPLELIFSDVWGPSPFMSTTGNKYYVSFVDHFSKFTWLYPIPNKSSVMPIFCLFQKLVERQFNCKIKSVQTDWGGEYRSLHTYFTKIGIQHRISCPHTSQQNGSVERKHRHIVEMGLSLLSHSHVPHTYWDNAFLMATYLINRLPTSPLGMSPLEKLYNHVPDFSSLKIFGCACFPFLRPFNRNKLDFRSKRCVFLGYSNSHRGFKCLDTSTGKVFVSRHVVFDEGSFPFANSNTSPPPPPSNLYTTLPTSLLNNINPSPAHQPNTTPTPASFPPTTPPSHPQPFLSSPSVPPPSQTISPPDINSSTPPNDSTPTPQPTQHISVAAELPVHRPHQMVTRSQHNIVRPKKNPDGTVRYPLPQTFLVTGTIPESPTCYSEASKHHEWRAAMDEEFTALMRNGTWSLVPATPGLNVVGSMWIFKSKRKSDGSLERRKARLVAKGYHQQPGIDFDDTFSPVVKPTTIRVMLSYAVSNQWPIHQIDIQNAFLHGNLSEEVYMHQPLGYVHPRFPNHICRLHKALYGLKQAPRAWYHRLQEHLLSLGFVNSCSDTSLFICRHGPASLFLLVYVDDILITGSNPLAISQLITNLSQEFAVKDLGRLKYFLGMEAHQLAEGLLLSQSQYIFNLLQRTNMVDAKPVSSPMSSSQKLSLVSGAPYSNPSNYRSVVGALQYLSLTRPDISFAVNKVCQFMHQPTDEHWTAVKRILRYLKFSIHFGLLIKPSTSTQLSIYSDADWAGCPDDRKSTSGFCLYLGDSLISWSSKKQPTVARSSTEAEYRAVAHATAESLWVQSLLREIGIPLVQCPILWCDNIGATYLTANPVFHARTKHVEIDYHFVREKVQQKTLDVRFISSRDQLADGLTKPIVSARFAFLRDKLNVISSPLILKGHIMEIQSADHGTSAHAITDHDKSADDITP
jgi:histone deacetylase 1/2